MFVWFCREDENNVYMTEKRVENMSKQQYKKDSWVGYGIIIGAAIGTVIFSLTNQPWYIAAGVSLGIVMGAIIDSIRSKS